MVASFTYKLLYSTYDLIIISKKATIHVKFEFNKQEDQIELSLAIKGMAKWFKATIGCFSNCNLSRVDERGIHL